MTNFFGYGRALTLLFAVFVFSWAAQAQTSAFTYQGQLIDGTLPANGTYQMQFSLFDAASGGSQIGSTITNTAVSVANGVFTVQLDFSPATPFAAGANRFLQIAVKKPADASYTTLAPRQQVTSSPYSIRTINAGTSDALSAACTTCVTDAQIAGVSGSKVTGTVASATTAATATSATTAGSATSATTAGNVTGTVAVANGGTGATSASAARTNLGLGSLATVTPTGLANSTTFLRGDNTYATISAGGGATLQLVATNTAAQTIGAGTSTASFNNTISGPPAGGSFNGTTFIAGSAGLYMINVSLGGAQSVIINPVFVINGTAVGFGANTTSTNFPGGVLSRANGTMTVSLAAGDTVVIQIASGAITNTTTLTTDGTTRLVITKLN